LIADNDRVLEGGVGTVGQRYHDKLQLYDGVAGKQFRRYVARYAGIDELAVGNDVRIESQYLRAGNGIQRFLLGFVVKDGNVGLAVQYLKIAHGKVENIHDPVVIVITEHDRLRGRVRVRVRQYG